jgi:hypothetical protein
MRVPVAIPSGEQPAGRIHDYSGRQQRAYGRKWRYCKAALYLVPPRYGLAKQPHKSNEILFQKVTAGKLKLLRG